MYVTQSPCGFFFWRELKSLVTLHYKTANSQKGGYLVLNIKLTALNTSQPSLPWWSLGGRADGGFVHAMSRKKTPREPVLLDAAEASEDESSPLCAEYYRGLSYAPNVAYIRNPPKDFRMGAILSAIFCFFPLGLLAIYYSFRTEKLFRSGNLSGSITASERTRLLINLTLLMGSLLWFGGVIGAVLFANRLHWLITFPESVTDSLLVNPISTAFFQDTLYIVVNVDLSSKF